MAAALTDAPGGEDASTLERRTRRRDGSGRRLDNRFNARASAPPRRFQGRGHGGGRHRFGAPGPRYGDDDVEYEHDDDDNASAGEDEFGARVRSEPPTRRWSEVALRRPAQDASPSSSSYDKAFFSDMKAERVGRPLGNALAACGYGRLAHIQANALLALRRATSGHRPGHSRGRRAMMPALLLADQAGAGKTLAYLMLAFQLMLERSAENGSGGSSGGSGAAGETATGGRIRRSPPGCPSVVVLVPTTELAMQTLRVVRSLSHADPACALRSLVMTGGEKAGRTRTQRKALVEGVDVVIGTPARISGHIRMGNMSLDSLKCLVVDEVDVLMEEHGGFGEDTDYILGVPVPQSCLSVVVSATVSKKNVRSIADRFVNVEVVTGPNVHRVAPGMTERLIDCGTPVSAVGAGGGARRGHRDAGGEVELDEEEVEEFEKQMFNLKAAALPAVLGIPEAPSGADGAPSAGATDAQTDGAAEPPPSGLFTRTIVFCNTIDSCRKVESFLKRRDRKEKRYRVLPYHNAIDKEIRDTNLKEFMRVPERDLDAASAAATGSRNGREISTFFPSGSAHHRGAGADEPGRLSPKRSMAEYRALPIIFVCTDRLSRGLDLITAEHAVLFDFPRDPHEYVRRVGRVCRGPRAVNATEVVADAPTALSAWEGMVTILAVGRQVALAKEIVERNGEKKLLHPYPRV